MCFRDADQPTDFKKNIVVASHEYQCCECDGVIGIGEKYERCCGIWAGEFEVYCTCQLCFEKREEIASAERSRGCVEAYPPFGELWDSVREMELS